MSAQERLGHRLPKASLPALQPFQAQDSRQSLAPRLTSRNSGPQSCLPPNLTQRSVADHRLPRPKVVIALPFLDGQKKRLRPVPEGLAVRAKQFGRYVSADELAVVKPSRLLDEIR